MTKIVLTGSTYAGKSSLLTEASAQGWVSVPEAGFFVIEELNALLGMEEQRQWRAACPVEFFTLIIGKQLELERKAIGAQLLIDRGAIDYLAFLRLVNVQPPDSLVLLCQAIRYDMAFLCPMLPGFSSRAHTGRSLDEEKSRHLFALCEEAYKEFGVPTATLPEGSLKERFGFIVKSIEQFAAPELKR